MIFMIEDVMMKFIILYINKNLYANDITITICNKMTFWQEALGETIFYVYIIFKI